MRAVGIGDQAPLFELAAVLPNRKIELVSLKRNMEANRWTILFFYPKDFTKICPTELTAISDRYDEFEELECQVIGISTDSIDTHLKWIATPRDQNGVGPLHFPLASDEKGSLSKSYDVLMEASGLAMRGVFIISPEGEIQYIAIFHDRVGRDVDEILRVLQGLQSEGYCPANWRPGDDLL